MIFKILSIVIYSMIDFNNWTIINYECIIKLTSKKYVHNSPRNSTLWGLSMIIIVLIFLAVLALLIFLPFLCEYMKKFTPNICEKRLWRRVRNKSES